MIIDTNILSSEWVVPKENDWGYMLKEGAPDDVVEEFEQYQKLVDSTGY